MNSIKNTFDEIKRMNKRKILIQIITLGMIVGSALMIWKTLMLITWSESPVVVVLTGSMEPAYFRGDILFLTNYYTQPYKPGDVVVFKVKDQEIPIVHRAIAVQPMGKNDFYLLSKGDNNPVDDRGLYDYAGGQIWLHQKDMLGKVVAYVPYIGYVTIVLNDYPILKWGLIGIMGLFVIIAKDPQN